MTKQAKRRLIPLIVLVAAAGVLAAIIFGPDAPNPPLSTSSETNTSEVAEITPEVKNTPHEVDNSSSFTTEPEAEILETKPVTGKLSLRLYGEENEPASLGSLDPSKAKMRVAFTRAGAGISSIRFSDIFETVDGKLAWNKYLVSGGLQPPIDDKYLLSTSHELAYNTDQGV